ncbi:uncharacterized protein FN964_005822 isoform 4-T10 [Alca torda]
MAASSKSEGGGTGGKRGSAGGSSVWPGSPGRREHVVRHLDRVKDEEPYNNPYLRVCEGLSDSSKVIVFSFKGVFPITATFCPQRRLPPPYQLFPGGLCRRRPRHRV